MLLNSIMLRMNPLDRGVANAIHNRGTKLHKCIMEPGNPKRLPNGQTSPTRAATIASQLISPLR